MSPIEGAPAPPPVTGANGTNARTDAPLYREKLAAPLWVWLVLFALAGSLAIAFWVPLGWVAGLTALVAGGLLVVWLLASTAPVITVTPTEVRVGRAHIEVDAIGIVATLDPSATTRARGPEADARAYTVIRTLTSKESVSLEVLDDEDPHPYWLISSRRPQELGLAIREAQGF